MIMRLLSLSLFWGLLLTTAVAAAPVNPLLLLEDKQQITVNNRVLAKVNGKPITVVDVLKKLDLIFFKQFAEYSSSSAARFHFYEINWQQVLSDLIDTELILADAKEAKIEITRGEIRQEIESQFGPQVMANLDKVGISFEEAWEMTKADLTIRRMMALRVQMKAQQKVSPSLVKKAFEQYKEANRKPSEWSYQLVTVRNPDRERGAADAQLLRRLLQEEGSSIADLAKTYKTLENISVDTHVTFSEELTHTEQDISETYKEILAELHPGDFSAPIAQESRSDKSTVHRIFALNGYKEGQSPSFEEVQAELQMRLTALAVQKDTEKYLKKLRDRFGITKELLLTKAPEDFKPFTLR